MDAVDSYVMLMDQLRDAPPIPEREMLLLTLASVILEDKRLAHQEAILLGRACIEYATRPDIESTLSLVDML